MTTPRLIATGFACLVVAVLLLTATVGAAAAPSQPANLGRLDEKWTGDLDGMVKRRRIRVLVVYSKTFYFPLFTGMCNRSCVHAA